MVATFESSSATSLGAADLPAVTAAERDDVTKFLAETATGDVPEGTTQILVTVNWTYGAGSTTDGYLNSLSLTPDTAVTAPVLTPPFSNVPHFDHVFLVFMENENSTASLAPANSGDYIYGNSAAPRRHPQGRRADLEGLRRRDGRRL